MRNNIPGLIKNLQGIKFDNFADAYVVGQVTVYLAYLYDILETTKNKQEASKREFIESQRDL